MVGNKAQKAVAAALTGILTLGTAAPALAGQQLTGTLGQPGGWYRVNGDIDTAYTAYDTTGVVAGLEDYKGKDRYDTMFDAVAYNADLENLIDGTTAGVWAPGTVDKIVLVSGTSYADALAASGLAGVLDCPVISTPADQLGTQAERLIKNYARFSPNFNLAGNPRLDVYIVGGEAAVSKKVYKAVDDISRVKTGQNPSAYQAVEVNPVRIWGNDRMTTSTSVMRFIDQYIAGLAWSPTNTIFVANGWAWADALSVSSYAYRNGEPIILTDTDGNLTADQLDYLKGQLGNGVNVICVGGPTELAYKALKDLDKKAGGVQWLAGDNRYETSKLVVETLGGVGENLAVATGKNWPDALIGGPFIGAQNGTLVLVGEQGETDWSVAVEEAIRQTKTAGFGFNTKFILGGTSAVNKETATVLTSMI